MKVSASLHGLNFFWEIYKWNLLISSYNGLASSHTKEVGPGSECVSHTDVVPLMAISVMAGSNIG